MGLSNWDPFPFFTKINIYIPQSTSIDFKRILCIIYVTKLQQNEYKEIFSAYNLDGYTCRGCPRLPKREGKKTINFKRKDLRTYNNL